MVFDFRANPIRIIDAASEGEIGKLQLENDATHILVFFFGGAHIPQSRSKKFGKEAQKILEQLNSTPLNTCISHQTMKEDNSTRGMKEHPYDRIEAQRFIKFELAPDKWFYMLEKNAIDAAHAVSEKLNVVHENQSMKG